jgi:hypothetical protein
MTSDENPKWTSDEKPKRKLLPKGPLKPPRPRPPGASVTQDRPSKDEVTIGAKRCRQGPTPSLPKLTSTRCAAEYKVVSLAGPMPQPFANPGDDPFAPSSAVDL